MLDSQTEPDRRAIVENVNSVAIESDELGEAVDRLGHAVEGVFSAGLATAGHIGSAEAGQVGSDHMEAIGQERDQFPEHVACTGEAMKQQQLGSFDRADMP